MRANTGIRDRGSSMRSHRWFTPWLLLGPAVAWVLVFALWPFLNTVFLSFTDARPLRTPEFVGERTTSACSATRCSGMR
ncbi:hypothetical protein [Microbacterium aurugineum]